MVLDAVERLGIEPSFCAGHSLGEYTALTATGALGFDDGVRLVVERSAAMHDAGLAQPGTMAAVLGLDDDQVEVACRRADADVWVANFNAPGQVVIAGSPVGRRRRRRPRQGARRQEGDAAAGVGSLPHPVHDRGPRPAAHGARRRPNPRDTDVPVVSNVDALAHDQGADWASLLSAQLSSPVRWKHCLLTLAEPGVTDFAELGPGARAHRHGEADRRPTPARSRSPPPRTSTSCSSGSAPARPSGPRQHEGEHLFAVERLVVSPGGRDLHPDRLDSPTGRRSTVGTVLGHVGDVEVRSPFAGVLQSYIALDTERVTARQPIAWLRSRRRMSATEG